MLKALSLLVIGSCLTAFSLTACISSGTQAPVSNRAQPPSTKIVTHRVAPGETLYAIAWRYGLDYKGLARANNIDRSYTILPGQTLYLRDNVGSGASPNSAKISRHGRQANASKKSRVTTRRSVKTTAPTQSSRTISETRGRKTKGRETTSRETKGGKGTINWRWPATGKLLAGFSKQQDLKKGIDIAGNRGDPVVAAAAGKVVYAGSGLRAYGNLVIIKHSEVYLSAYAHNQRLRVKEGDSVKRGQRIADMGFSGTGTGGTPKLHFQIRRDGKPVNPLPLLPKRLSKTKN